MPKRIRQNLIAALVLVLVTASLGCKSTQSQQTDDESATSSQATKDASNGEEQTEGGGDSHKHQKSDHAHDRHHAFEHPERYAKRWNDPARDDWQKPGEVIELMGVEPGMTVVDLGTGTGYFLPHLSKAVGADGKVWALDISEKMIEYVESQTMKALPHDNVETRLVERNDPKLKAESVDSILMVNTWHHVTDRTAYAKKLLAGLKPGGTFVDVDYTVESGKGPPKKIKLEPAEVVSELEKAGFNAKVAEESLPDQYVVVATKPGKDQD